MTAIVSMALGKRDIPRDPKPIATTANFLLPTASAAGVRSLLIHRVRLIFAKCFFGKKVQLHICIILHDSYF